MRRVLATWLGKKPPTSWLQRPRAVLCKAKRKGVDASAQVQV